LRGTRVGGSGELDARHIVVEPLHVYNLPRGHMSAIVQGISVSEDGRWTAVGRGSRPFIYSRLIRKVVL
jgi:hypothetical protein